MIRITVELVSARDAKRDRLLGLAYIDNEGPVEANPAICRYALWLSKTLPGQTGQAWKTGRAAIREEQHCFRDAALGEVPAFHNERRGVWDLIYLGLKAIVGSRNP